MTENVAKRLRTSWRAAHAPVAGVPRWARTAAYAVPLVVLPSGLWRLPAAFREGAGLGERTYIVCLSILSELLAFTAVGLIAHWGERIGGRRIPAPVALVPATIGAAVLTFLGTPALVAVFAGLTVTGQPAPASSPAMSGGWEAVIFYACYLPLLLWGPLLAAVTYAYYRRRCRAPQRHLSRGLL